MGVQVLPGIHATQLDNLLTGVDLPSEKDITTVVADKPIKQ
jgi:hypothetical protein